MNGPMRYMIPHRGRVVRGSLIRPSENCPLVVFSHGFGGRGADFSGTAKALAEQGIGSLCIDFCGGSRRAQQYLSTEQMTLETEQEDLHAAIDRLLADGVPREKLFLFGGSQGGLVTALAAAERPQDVRGVILLYPALCIPDDWQRQFPTEADIPAHYTLWGVRLGRGYFESARKTDVFARIGQYTGPVLLLHGDADKVVPIAYSRRAEKLYPQARLIEFAGEGHGFSAKGNSAVAAYTAQFIRSCCPQ